MIAILTLIRKHSHISSHHCHVYSVKLMMVKEVREGAVKNELTLRSQGDSITTHIVLCLLCTCHFQRGPYTKLTVDIHVALHTKNK